MFNPLAAKAVFDCFVHLSKPFTVVELGNQRFDAQGVADGLGLGKIKDTKDFYEKLGVEKYVALDLNSRMYAEPLDLNRNLMTEYKYHETFALVTNNGTGEHIFNQLAVFENIHNLCRQGGIMLHVLPMVPWLNHGLYNYTPVLFRDLAAANNYHWSFLWIGDRFATPYVCDLVTTFKEKRPRELQAIVDKKYWTSDLSIVAALQKVDNQLFRIPLQGKYKQDVETPELKRRYL